MCDTDRLTHPLTQVPGKIVAFVPASDEGKALYKVNHDGSNDYEDLEDREVEVAMKWARDNERTMQEHRSLPGSVQAIGKMNDQTELWDNIENFLEKIEFARTQHGVLPAIDTGVHIVAEHPTLPKHTDQQKITFGMKVQGAERGAGLTADTTKANETLIHLLTRSVTLWAEKFNPDFTWTSIQVAKNTKFPPHCDRGSPSGSSVIIGLGNFTGGGLRVYDPRDDRVSELAIKRNFQIFDGRGCPHFTQDFNGTRYSIIYYTKIEFPNLIEEDRNQLARLGFKLPTSLAKEAWLPAEAEEDLVDRALQRYNEHGIGDWHAPSSPMSIQDPEASSPACFLANNHPHARARRGR